MSDGANGRKILLTIVGVIVAVGIGKFIGGFLGESAAQRANQSSRPVVPVAGQIAPIIAAITIQDTEGTSEADFDLEALKRLEEHLVETTLRRARANYAKQGFDPKTYNPKMDANSVFTVVGGKKLAIIRMSVDSQVRTVWIMGFQRDQFIRVSCIRASNHDIPIFSGECGQKLTEAFGVSLTAQAGVVTPERASSSANLDMQMVEAARRGDVAAVTSLVAKGADVSARTPHGYSALSGASGKGHTEVVRFLLSKGVNVNERLRGGTNALDEASFWGHLDTVRFLLTKGAGVNVQKDNGYTPLMSAAMNGHIRVVELLLKSGANVNMTNQVGGTALHAAAVPGQRAVIEVLLRNGADPNVRNKGGYTYMDLLARTR